MKYMIQHKNKVSMSVSISVQEKKYLSMLQKPPIYPFLIETCFHVSRNNFFNFIIIFITISIILIVFFGIAKN